MVDCTTGYCASCWFDPAYEELEDLEPDVVVLMGTEETTGIVGWTSAIWEANNKTPINWIVSEGGQVSSLLMTSISTPKFLVFCWGCWRESVWGRVPGCGLLDI